jgi:hypothetical protein
MASFQYLDYSSSTVGSAYTAADGTLTVATGEGSKFPASGDYWISVTDKHDDSATYAFVRKVTSRSGDVLTLAAGVSAGTDHNAAVGAYVDAVIGKAALDQLRLDIVAQVGSGGSVPAGGSTGQVLEKLSGTDYDVGWGAPGGGGGGVSGPGGVSAGLRLWLKADAITGLSDGDYVTSWLDSAAADGGHFASAQATSTSNYPVYKTAVLNSLPIVRFNGSGWLRTLVDLDPQFSCFLVAKFTSLSNSYTAVLASLFWDNGGFFVKSNGTTAFYTAWDGSSVTGVWDGSGSATMNNSTYYIITLLQGPTSASSRVALSADVTNASFCNTIPFTVLNGILCIGNHSSSGRVFAGDIAEVVLYNRTLSSAEVSSVESALKTKWGL